MIDEYCMIEIAFDDLEETKRTIKALLEEKLVSSCQMLESQSTWLWHQEIESAKEYLVFVKTKKNLSTKIYNVVRKYHSYETFEFAIMPITSTSKNYLAWINNEVRGKEY